VLVPLFYPPHSTTYSPSQNLHSPLSYPPHSTTYSPSQNLHSFTWERTHWAARLNLHLNPGGGGAPWEWRRQIALWVRGWGRRGAEACLGAGAGGRRRFVAWARPRRWFRSWFDSTSTIRCPRERTPTRRSPPEGLWLCPAHSVPCPPSQYLRLYTTGAS